MDLKQSREKAAKEGTVHFWDLPRKNLVVLKPEAKDRLMNSFMRDVKTIYGGNKVTGISRNRLSYYLNEINPRISIRFLLRIFNIGSKNLTFLEYIEKNIIWIGFSNSEGVSNPKLPFNFNSRAGARFLAAICNDGWISDGACYSNSEEDLRESVKRDALAVFGGNSDVVKLHITGNDLFLRFPSIVRDTLILLTDFKGNKSENNPSIPSFILEDKNLICGWIEQTIADEGCVKFYPQTYRREIMWKRAFKKDLNDYKLHRDEKIMLNKIGIEYDLYDNVGNYKTVNGVNKITILIRIARKKNLLKLGQLIKIPNKRKDKLFARMMPSYVQDKKSDALKNAIIKICKEKKFVTSPELSKIMKYKQVTTAIKWLRFYLKEGLLLRVSESYYNSEGRIPAKYALNKSQRI